VVDLGSLVCSLDDECHLAQIQLPKDAISAGLPKEFGSRCRLFRRHVRVSLAEERSAIRYASECIEERICHYNEKKLPFLLQLPIASNHKKIGFGSSEADYSNVELDSNLEKKQAVWRKTQKRYKELADP